MSALVSIDGAEFARREEQLDGAVPLSALTRLQDVLTDTEGEIRFRMKGQARRDGKPALRLSVAGSLRVECQRCLRPVEIDVESSRTLVFVPSSALAVLGDEEEDADYLPSEEHVLPVELVVDELLLAMPISPRHPEGECPEPILWVASATADGQPLN